MVSLPERSALARAYRFAVRVSGRALPCVDKVLRLRCTLYAADHDVVGVSALVVRLGTVADCDHSLELVHEPAASDAARPRYFELVACVAPVAEPASRLRDLFAPGCSDGSEYRIAGMMDPQHPRVTLPAIVLSAG
jgi:hypothetical protein